MIDLVSWSADFYTKDGIYDFLQCRFFWSNIFKMPAKKYSWWVCVRKQRLPVDAYHLLLQTMNRLVVTAERMECIIQPHGKEAIMVWACNLCTI